MRLPATVTVTVEEYADLLDYKKRYEAAKGESDIAARLEKLEARMQECFPEIR